jgi:hypothetical protein
MTAKKNFEATIRSMPTVETSPALAVMVGHAAATAFFDGFGFGARNMDAMVKSRTILARGVRALDNASLGVALMSVEHAAAAAKGISECRTFAELVDVRNCVVKLGLGRMVESALMLSNMAVQVAEDASVPLTRRMNAVLDECAMASAT